MFLKFFFLILALMLINACNSDEKSDRATNETESTASSIASEDFVDGSDFQNSTTFLEGVLKVIDSLPDDVRDTTFIRSSTSLPRGCKDMPLSRGDLTGLKTIVKIFNGRTNAGISVPGFGGVALGKSETNYNIYYIEPKIVVCGRDTVVYGCGYSVHLRIKKLKRGLDVSKLAAIAASVQLENNKTNVYYSIGTHGISGTVLVKYFKPVVNKPFDVDGFNIMQLSIDGIHEVLSDEALSKSVKFSPVEVKFIKAVDLEQ